MTKSYLLVVVLTACTSQSSAQLSGKGVYRDAATTHDGTPQQPAAATDHATVTVVVKGTATLPQVDARCATDPVGVFEAHYASTTAMSDGGVYTAALANGMLTTPSGCTISTLSGAVVTDVTVHAEIAATTTSCQSYCDAKARADAEAQCGATATAASCRTSAESSISASCTSTCTTQAHAIAADLDLGAGALGSVSADELKGAAFGDLSANLTFDHTL